MIIIMDPGVKAEAVEIVTERLSQEGLSVHVSRGVTRTVIGVIGDKSRISPEVLEAMPGVEKVVPIMKPYKMAGRDFHPEDTVIKLGDIQIGGGHVVVAAGPCAVESKEQLLQIAQIVKAGGAQFLRGGAYKPRSSPYAFQGLEEQGLIFLAEARDATGLKIVTEVIDPRSVQLVAEYVDVLQVGARNMQNFNLLREVGRTDLPILLKRGLAATLEEFLLAAEYIISSGNPNVILCERGIRTFETYTRNTLDLSAVPALKHLTHLPVMVDPSHGTGKWRLVAPMAKAALAAGADGLIIEVHHDPAKALSDGPQSLTPENYHSLMQQLNRLATALDVQLPGVKHD